MVAFLNELPITKHDWSTFTVDVSLALVSWPVTSIISCTVLIEDHQETRFYNPVSDVFNSQQKASTSFPGSRKKMLGRKWQHHAACFF